MDRTLYFNEAKGVELQRDGPSVWVKEEGKAGRRIPIGLVGRAVIIGNVRLDAGIITLFADNHIPVIFMNKKGEEAAVTIPFNHKLPKHHEEQAIFLKSERNINAFKTWLFAQRRNQQINTIKRLSRAEALRMTSQGFREKDYKLFISRLISYKEGLYKAASAIINNLLKEMAVESLLKADLDPHIGVFNRRHNFGLALDICYAIEPEADLQSVMFIKTSADSHISPDDMKDIVHRFENKRMIVHEIIETIIDDIFKLMRELRL